MVDIREVIYCVIQPEIAFGLVLFQKNIFLFIVGIRKFMA